jgi:hypothetical protein
MDLRITARPGRPRRFPPEHVAEVKAIACEHGRHVPGSSRTTRTSRPRPAGRWTSTPTCATANGRARTSTNTNRASAAAHVTRVQVSSERRDSWLRAAVSPPAETVGQAREHRARRTVWQTVPSSRWLRDAELHQGGSTHRCTGPRSRSARRNGGAGVVSSTSARYRSALMPSEGPRCSGLNSLSRPAGLGDRHGTVRCKASLLRPRAPAHVHQGAQVADQGDERGDRESPDDRHGDRPG